MGIILWIIFGALVGWVASKIMNTDASQGAFANVIVGIVGALIGGFLAGLLGFGGITGFNIGSLIIALVGEVVYLWIVKAVKK